MAIKKEKKQVINIDEQYYIEVDELNWTLHCLKPTDPNNKNAKNPFTDTVLGYYGNLKQCCDGYVRHRQLEVKYANNLDEYCELIEKHNKETISRVESLLSKSQSL